MGAGLHLGTVICSRRALLYQAYVEDKREQANDSEVRSDLVKALTLARKIHEEIIFRERLACVVFGIAFSYIPCHSEEGALGLVLPVVLTCWPEVRYGSSEE